MSNVVCNECSHRFDPTNYLVTGVSTGAGAAAGAFWGSKIGLALGPLGAIAGTIPGAIIGGVFAGGASTKVAKCPCCDNIMSI
ncbi:MAG: hypothetical protein RPS47_04945 [Colwellia sp.]|jgi:hypothetical protein